MLNSLLQNKSMDVSPAIIQRMLYIFSALLVLTSCSTRLDPAFITEHSSMPIFTNSTAVLSALLDQPPPGYYRVKSGQTLYSIALENGKNYRDIAAWNNLTNPN
ncbi:hypothetical protein GJV44_00181 [Candidatus Vallotia cooleyia]|nr:hypothetical protein GJV44_00181 [Candidatus Vallotia cooleyia]